jgi:hypothetical protein
MNEDLKASIEEVKTRVDEILDMRGALSAVATMQEEIERLRVEVTLLEVRLNVPGNPPSRKFNWFVIGVALYGAALALILVNSQRGLALPWSVAFWFWSACMAAVLLAKK